MYNRNVKAIEAIKKQIYLGEETVDILDCDMETLRPSSIYENLNPQGEQDLEDDKEEGLTDDPKYAALDYNGKTETIEDGPKLESYRYRQIDVPTDKELSERTRTLVPEQLVILLRVVQFCKDVVKFRKTKVVPTP